MNKIKSIIFDFDGTLVDTQVDIMTSFKEAIYKIKGINIDSFFLKIGPPLDEMIKSFFPKINSNEINDIVITFRKIYSNCGFYNTTCYEGIPELLQFLKKDKLSIFIATNKPLNLTLKIIDKLELHYFESVCTIDMIQGHTLSKKEMISFLIEENHLERDSTVMVGDSPLDIKAAIENQIISIGVGYGYESREKILEAKPRYFIDSGKQFVDVFKNII